MQSKDDAIRALRAQIADIESSSFDFRNSEAAQKGLPRLKNERIESLRSEMKQVEAMFAAAGSNMGDRLEEGEDEGDDSVKKLSSEDAFQRIVRWTSRRFRSEHELRKRLHEAGFSDAQCFESIERAKRCLLIDDERFADILIRSRLRQGKGKSGIEFELKREGVDPESLPGWPQDYFDYSEATEVDRALEFLNSKTIRAKDVRGAAYRRLVQKGYSSSVAQTASRIWCDAR